MINVSLLYINFEDEKQTTLIKCDKNKLINKSPYFSALLSGNFSDNETNLSCDLTLFEYSMKEEHVIIYFDYVLDNFNVGEKKDDNITFSFGNSSCNSSVSTFDVNDIFAGRIPIKYWYTIIQLNNYFMFSNFDDIIHKAVKKYYNALIKNKYDFINIDCNVVISSDDTFDKTKLNNIIIQKKKSYVMKLLTDDIMMTYITFNMSNNIKAFEYIIEQHSSKKNTFNVKKCMLNMSLIDAFNMVEIMKKYMVLKNECINIYDHYDMLAIENHTFNVINKQTSIKKPIMNNDEFTTMFNKLTNNIFSNFNWDNVCVAGGFIYSLLTDTILESTDIDLFVYGNPTGTEEVVDNKVKYILKYFQDYKPYYAVNKSVINIIMESIRFDIQIIPYKDVIDPIDVIKQFDLSYCMLFYDGKTVSTNIFGFTSLKYRVSSVGKTAKNNDYRIFKAINKGVEIIKGDFEYDLDKKRNLNANGNIARVIIKNCSKSEIYNTLHKLYNAKNIWTDNDKVVFDNNFNNDMNYSLLIRRNQKVIDLEKCTLELRGKKKRHYSSYDIVNVDKKIINYTIFFQNCKIYEVSNRFVVIFVDDKMVDILTKLLTFVNNNIHLKNFHVYTDEARIKIHMDYFLSKNNSNNIHGNLSKNDIVTAECTFNIWESNNGGIKSGGIKFFLKNMEVTQEKFVMENNNIKFNGNKNFLCNDDYKPKKVTKKRSSSSDTEEEYKPKKVTKKRSSSSETEDDYENDKYFITPKKAWEGNWE